MNPINQKYESMKFDSRRKSYYKGLKAMQNLGYVFDDYIHHFPSFAGHMTIARFLGLYELYKMSLGVAGHIAEAGIHKGFGTIGLAKIVKIFEPESLTLVHGFDWFLGMDSTNEEPNILKGSYKEDYKRLMKLINAQQLGNIIHIHKLDLKTELGTFFKTNSYLQFKLVIIDAGQYDIVASCLRNFWERITPGGILVFDSFNHEISPGETRAIKELLPNSKIRTLPWLWTPTAFVVKE
ncbi:MAG: class I SAM-dependent methyltransferase [Candidatus Omnitrophica bacterium]|nr:class I SAM-dependent methyltransferase [Candidatus Omnitrophota bacterium]MDD5429614.1 class I SAM-dependent methyltransferase [Candidatus Omnitrophota bacterium]